MEGCTCGLYAVKSGPDAPPAALIAWQTGAGREGRVVIARVHLVGKIIEHEIGYRAEMARVVELLPVPGQGMVARLLARTYAVRVSKELLNRDSASRVGVRRSEATA
jgi:hypothetical protein